MPALVATRFNPNLKAKYDPLRAKGRPPKAAITAVMRKLIVLANALLKAHPCWAPKRAWSTWLLVYLNVDFDSFNDVFGAQVSLDRATVCKAAELMVQ